MKPFVSRWGDWEPQSSEIELGGCLGRPASHCHNCPVQLASHPAFQPRSLKLQITRRKFCQSTAALFLTATTVGITFLPPFTRAALAETIPADELMKPDGLPEMVMGNDKAPVTVIEYASMTCPHCAHFQETTFPELKKRYIDTGKVRYIFREFPLDNLAAAAFMLARCAGK